MEHSDALNELAAALAKAQAAFTAVPKGKTAKVATKAGGEYSYKYADLADAWDVARKHLSDNGLSVIQAPAQFDRGVCTVTTLLLHTSGQWIKSALALDARDATPQSIGSVITYARRYGLAAMIGLVTDDDTDAQEHRGGGDRQPARAQSGAQQGRTNGAASYTRGEGGIKPVGKPGDPIRAAHAIAHRAGVKVEPVPTDVDTFDEASLAGWLAYYQDAAKQKGAA